MYNKVNYNKYGKQKDKESGAYENGSSEDEETPAMTYNEELEHLLFFRTCVVSRDKAILKIKLKQTVALRENTLKKPDTKFPQAFPFYFVSPDLVLMLFLFFIQM